MLNHCDKCQQIQKQIIEECGLENSILRQQNVSPDKLLASNQYKKFHHKQQKIRKLAQKSNGYCSKHFRCISQKNQKQNQQIINISQIPEYLLIDQQPTFIDIHPQKPILNIYNIDGLVTQNLNLHKRVQRQQQKINKQNKKKQKQKLDHLAQQAKIALRKSKKKQVKNCATWGHSIFTVNDPVNDKDKNDDKNELKQQKQQNRRKIQLKPIQQRISDYKKTVRQEKKRKQQTQKFRNNHHQQCQIKVNIKKNAQEILDKKKKQKQRQQQKKKMIEAKIRAIQLHSKENIRKSKKIPVDSNVQFIVQIPNKQSKKKQMNKDSLKKLNNQQIQPRRNFLKKSSKSFNRNAQKSTNSIKIQTQRNDQQKIQDNNEQKNVHDSKFYVWNIPIHKQDYECIVQDQIQNVDKDNKQIKNFKSFREQVDEYLQEKFHLEMKKQVEQRKKKQFNNLVQEKKKQYLSDFIQKNMQQIYWNEDEVFKPQKIKNFQYK